jgi:type III restriction enzyme
MILQFDKNQAYQLAAIQAVVDLFVGQPTSSTGAMFSLNELAENSTAISNNLQLPAATLLDNLIQTQINNKLYKHEISNTLETLFYQENNERIETSFPNYSIEMETGTGKTYVYLRTIYELNKQYGFKKFVIVVPSVAIREGVLKTLQITHTHLQEIYAHTAVEYNMYDPNKLHELGYFSNSNAIQILIINIDSFAKDGNIINQTREAGIKPIAHIQQCNPIVIIDEPQNMETDIRKKAIANLNPLCTLRYSATHKNIYNLVYKLDPVRAYELGLVKQIEVDSITAKNNYSAAYISVHDFKIAKRSITALLSIFTNEKKGLAKRTIEAKIGDDLFALSKRNDVYKTGFVINELDATKGVVRFSNGQVIQQGQAIGGLTDEVQKEMIDATVENHFKKEKELSKKGVKVLSLFFIDKVAHYKSYAENGEAIKGKYAQWFEESFTKWLHKPAYKGMYTHEPQYMHNGYFSQDKGKLKDSKENSTTKADDETYKLIMQDKERLLDVATPLRFIFSHSALREGWDNPNVFQICTLNETKSDIKKRQEIGRGLRLCVDDTGARNMDSEVNRLTIIANESYESFSTALQKEIEEDCAVQFAGRIKNAIERTQIKLKDNWANDALFNKLWDKINYKTTYTLSYSSNALIKACATAIQAMPATASPALYREKNSTHFARDKKGNLTNIIGTKKMVSEKAVAKMVYDIPDFIPYLQSKTNLTYETISQIMLLSNRLGDIFINPQLFIAEVVKIMLPIINTHSLHGVQYEKINAALYNKNIFEAAATEQYSTSLYKVKNAHKTLYNFILIDTSNQAEKALAMECDGNDDILFYTKLPKSFCIKTMLGNYSPSWAVVKKGKTKNSCQYFVVDIEGGKDVLAMKEFAEKHFAVMDAVEYKVVGGVSEL